MEHLQVAFGHEDFDSGGNIANYASLRLDHVRVTQGRAGAGGGVANLGGTLVIEHSLIDHNLATSREVAAWAGASTASRTAAGALMIRDSTIAYNGAEAGGGIAVEYYGQISVVGDGGSRARHAGSQCHERGRRAGWGWARARACS